MLGFLRRRIFFLATIAASFGVPYAMFDPGAKSQLQAWRQAIPSIPSTSSLPSLPSWASLPSWSSSKSNSSDSDSDSDSAGSQPARGGNPALLPGTLTTSLPPDAPGVTTNNQSPRAWSLTSPPSNRDAPVSFGSHPVTLPDMLEGPPVKEFGEAFRFDVNTRWITSRWSRVTTVLSEYELEGLRVPFVSGTRLDDIAGSLTYYYDRNHRLQRITFEGLTGDERRLATFLQQTFNLQPEPSLYAGFYASRWNAQLKSVLVVRHAPVVKAEEPFRQFEIFLEINRPDDFYQLSEPVRKELQQGLQSSRWGI